MLYVKNRIKTALLASIVLFVSFITAGASVSINESPMPPDAVSEFSEFSVSSEICAYSEISFESVFSESSAEDFDFSETIRNSETIPDQSFEETAGSSACQLNKNDSDEWALILINRQNPVPEGYEPILAEVENGRKVDYRIAEALEEMLADARADGIIPRITSAYRPSDDQTRVMNQYIDKFIKQGYTREQAEEEARKWVALPGTSEHQIGLAVDISTRNSKKQSARTVWKWFGEHCRKYGFIQRYTERCSKYTGAPSEPWHFRYVGVEYAKDIADSGLCFEEWLEARVGTE